MRSASSATGVPPISGREMAFRARSCDATSVAELARFPSAGTPAGSAGATSAPAFRSLMKQDRPASRLGRSTVRCLPPTGPCQTSARNLVHCPANRRSARVNATASRTGAQARRSATPVLRSAISHPVSIGSQVVLIHWLHQSQLQRHLP